MTAPDTLYALARAVVEACDALLNDDELNEMQRDDITMLVARQKRSDPNTQQDR